MAAAPIPELPPGKTYHAYIVYKTDSPDSIVAFDIVSCLESQYGMACCIQDRDFLPGLAIVDNIDLFLQRSFKIVILLSEASLASQWVEHELNVALYLHLQKDGGLQQQIIPVKLDSCQLPPKIAFIYSMNTENVPKKIWMKKLALAVKCTEGLENLYGRGEGLENLYGRGEGLESLYGRDVPLVDCIYSRHQNGENGSHEMQLSEESLCAVGNLIYGGTKIAKCFRVGHSYVITTAKAANQIGSVETQRIDGSVEFPLNANSTRNKKKFRLKSLKFMDEDLDVAIIKFEKTIFRRPPRRLCLSSDSESSANFTDVYRTCEMGSPCIVDGNSTVRAMSLEAGDGRRAVKAVKMAALLGALGRSDLHDFARKLFE
ncbi:uncharacterized protein LOC117327705 [Pecten maximus]|uniref:uncharacterized protein LOC117327705 n=1 Tax=Pecten maximus TaxID=6579 RepID=UPI001458AAB2|nr:uncharacterized protein LOC117327705 [Pecten maximus]